MNNRTFLILIISILGVACYSQSASRIDGRFLNEELNAIDTLEAAINAKMKQYGVVGASIALVDDQRILWSQGFGFTAKDQGRTVNDETIFSIQSISKSYLATAALMEATEGRINLDTPIVHYYPEFRISSRFDLNDFKKITIRHLLSHKSGLLKEAPIGSNYDTADCSFDEHIQSFKSSWLRFPVGKFFSYSNMGMDLVGYILSKRSSLDYPEYIEKRLLNPLGMNNTTFNQDKVYVSGNFAKGYIGEVEMKKTRIVSAAAGGIYSNVLDMSKFISFQLRGCTFGSDSTISENLINDMGSVQFKTRNQAVGYGLGVYIKPFHQATLIYHNGGGYGYSTQHLWIPELRIGLVILSNDGSGSPFVREVSQLALNCLLRLKGIIVAEPEAIGGEEKSINRKLSAFDLRSLTGSYKGDGVFIDVFTDKKNLVIRKYGDTLRLRALSRNEFSSVDGQQFKFITDDEDFPQHVICVTQNREEFYILNEKVHEKIGAPNTKRPSIIGTYVGYNNRQLQEFEIFAKNGSLYTSFMSFGGATKIHPYSRNLFFTTDGESIIIDGDKLYFGNRPFRRKSP